MKFFKDLSIVTKIIIGLLLGALLGLWANHARVGYLNIVLVYSKFNHR